MKELAQRCEVGACLNGGRAKGANETRGSCHPLVTPLSATDKKTSDGFRLKNISGPGAYTNEVTGAGGGR